MLNFTTLILSYQYSQYNSISYKLSNDIYLIGGQIWLLLMINLTFADDKFSTCIGIWRDEPIIVVFQNTINSSPFWAGWGPDKSEISETSKSN